MTPIRRNHDLLQFSHGDRNRSSSLSAERGRSEDAGVIAQFKELEHIKEMLHGVPFFQTPDDSWKEYARMFNAPTTRQWMSYQLMVLQAQGQSQVFQAQMARTQALNPNLYLYYSLNMQQVQIPGNFIQVLKPARFTEIGAQNLQFHKNLQPTIRNKPPEVVVIISDSEDEAASTDEFLRASEDRDYAKHGSELAAEDEGSLSDVKQQSSFLRKKLYRKRKISPNRRCAREKRRKSMLKLKLSESNRQQEKKSRASSSPKLTTSASFSSISSILPPLFDRLLNSPQAIACAAQSPELALKLSVCQQLIQLDMGQIK